MTQELMTLIRRRIAKPKMIHDMARSMSPAPQVNPPTTPEQIAATEANLGFSLPPLYRQLLTGIGNGGFGPGYGLLGAQGGHADFDGRSLTEVYRQTHDMATRRDDAPLLPEKMLPICNWGCGIYSCLDCRETDAPVYFYNPDLHVLADDRLASTVTDAKGVVVWTYQPEPIAPVESEIEPQAVCLILHRRSLAEWLTAWASKARLWDEMENLLTAF